MIDIDDIPLRERKYAQTKLAILEATLDQLLSKSFEAISIKGLCKHVQISEATFFNYFERKTDILVYFIQLWTIEVSWHAREAAGDNTGLGVIEAIFDFTARQSALHPTITREIIAFQATMDSDTCKPKPITLAERLLAFPKLTNLEDLPAEGLDSILPAQVIRAIKLGELPSDTDVGCAVLALVSIFFGIPLTMYKNDPNTIPDLYRQQLNLLWTGVRAGGCKNS